MFLSLKPEIVEKHWSEEHTLLRTEPIDKQLTKRQIKCLGCMNVFHTKYALQIHLLCDHNVITTEVHDIIAATLAANRAQREAKRQENAGVRIAEGVVEGIPEASLAGTDDVMSVPSLLIIRTGCRSPCCMCSQCTRFRHKHSRITQTMHAVARRCDEQWGLPLEGAVLQEHELGSRTGTVKRIYYNNLEKVQKHFLVPSQGLALTGVISYHLVQAVSPLHEMAFPQEVTYQLHDDFDSMTFVTTRVMAPRVNMEVQHESLGFIQGINFDSIFVALALYVPVAEDQSTTPQYHLFVDCQFTSFNRFSLTLPVNSRGPKNVLSSAITKSFHLVMRDAGVVVGPQNSSRAYRLSTDTIIHSHNIAKHTRIPPTDSPKQAHLAMSVTASQATAQLTLRQYESRCCMPSSPVHCSAPHVRMTSMLVTCTTGKSANSNKTKVVSQQTEPVKIAPSVIPTSVPMSLDTTIYQLNVTTGASRPAVTIGTEQQKNDTWNEVATINAVLAEPTKVDEPKPDQVTEFPPTPNFSLFSDLQLNNDKDTTAVIPEACSEVDNKKPVFDKCAQNLPRPKVIKSRTKSDVGSTTIKFKYKCRVERCGVRLTNAVSMEHHLRCHKVDSDVMYCTECDFTAISWNSLAMHLWREHKVDVDLFSCKQCDYKTNSYSKLNNHVKIHSNERPFLCDICGKGFKTTKQLRNHKGIHRAKRKFEGSLSDFMDIDIALRKNTCNICGRTFADSRILKIHTENVHNKARPYLCSFCSHSASSKSSLRIHVRQHTGEKPFSCSECDYVTSDHNSLRRHKMRHSGKRPYHCPHCSYTSIQATTYKAHLKNKHPGLDEGLMFSCPMCPFRTIKKDNFLTHKAQHGVVVIDGFQNKPKNPETQQVSLNHNGIEQFFNVDKHCKIVIVE
ncbi:hypothetical protein J6590_075563 [Homalodisca vitripennis]|nr:hypothetical protein J6590_075563 [Homalodisca vitripennis]